MRIGNRPAIAASSDRDAVTYDSSPARLLETVAVAADQLLEQNGNRAAARRFRRRPPFPPRADPIVEEQPLDDDREIGPNAAAPLKFSEDAVVVFDELQLDVRCEIVGFESG